MSSGSVSTAGNVIYSLPGCSETIEGLVIMVGVVTSGTASSSTNFIVPGNDDIQAQLLVIALNSEASTYDLNISVSVNSTAVQMDNVAYNAYSGSGTNRRNYRVVSCDKLFSGNDTVSISVTNRSSYTSFVYALVDSTLKFGEVQKLLSSYSRIIIGRMGIPDKESGYNTISLTVKGSLEDISALSGKLGKLSNVAVKSALTSVEIND